MADSARKLLEDIIAEAVQSSTPLADCLRKCLVLASAINNERLRDWARHELNGYDSDNVPEYRIVSAGARGFFIGMVQRVNDQPLAAGVLEERQGIGP